MAMRGVKGVLARMHFLSLILAIVPTGAGDELDFAAERYKRNALFGSFAGYGPGPHAPVPPAGPYGPELAPMPGPAPGPPMPGPGVPGPIAPVPGPIGPGACPGGPSLGKPCDAKRPWPQCPPHSYCFAVNSVDIGPYYCCPVWSTMGAQWRPAAPFYPYYPPMPYNWPYVIQATAHWGAQTSPAAGWLGQFGPSPGLPAGPAGAAYLAPAVPDIPGPYMGPPPPHVGAPVPGGPFEKARKKNPEATKVDTAVAAATAEKEKSESS